MSREDLIYKKCIEKWGINDQLDQSVEEAAELIQAINKFKRQRGDNIVNNLIEEIVDTEVMIGQVKVILDQECGDYAKFIYAQFWDEKLKRISEMLEKEE